MSDLAKPEHGKAQTEPTEDIYFGPPVPHAGKQGLELPVDEFPSTSLEEAFGGEIGSNLIDMPEDVSTLVDENPPVDVLVTPEMAPNPTKRRVLTGIAVAAFGVAAAFGGALLSGGDKDDQSTPTEASGNPSGQEDGETPAPIENEENVDPEVETPEVVEEPTTPTSPEVNEIDNIYADLETAFATSPNLTDDEKDLLRRLNEAGGYPVTLSLDYSPEDTSEAGYEQVFQNVLSDYVATLNLQNEDMHLATFGNAPTSGDFANFAEEQSSHFYIPRFESNDTAFEVEDGSGLITFTGRAELAGFDRANYYESQITDPAASGSDVPTTGNYEYIDYVFVIDRDTGLLDHSEVTFY